MDPVSFLGLISMTKDLADIAKETIKFGKAVIKARTKLEAYCKEVDALESLPVVTTNDPAVQLTYDYLKHETTALRRLVDGLKNHGICSRFRFAFKDKELDRLLHVIDRAKGSLQLVQLLQHVAVAKQHAAVVNQQMQALRTQTDALQATQLKLVSTTDAIHAKVHESALHSWLHVLLCVFTSPKELHYTPIPRFVRTFHDVDSEIVTTMLEGNKAEVINLVRSGQAHPGHTVLCSRPVSNSSLVLRC